MNLNFLITPYQFNFSLKSLTSYYNKERDGGHDKKCHKQKMSSGSGEGRQICKGDTGEVGLKKQPYDRVLPN